MILSILIFGILVAFGVYFTIFYLLATPTEENLRSENHELKQNYSLIESRLENSNKIIREIQHRDSNLYRVLLQMEPMEELNYGNILSLSPPASLKDINDATLVSGLLNQLDSLDAQLLNQIISFNTIRKVAMQNQQKLDHTPSVLPINIDESTMSSGYGIRIDPIYKSQVFHAGLDFAADMGTQVFATADGTVSSAALKTGYGNCVDIEHGYNFKTRYAHLSEILVEEGQTVKRGDLIGLVGSTGKSTGPHLHYEVHFKDQPENPVNYYFMDLTPEQYEEMIELAENAGHIMD